MRPTQQTIKNLHSNQKARLSKLAREGATREKIVEERKRTAAQLRALRLIDKAVRDSQKITQTRN